jgi:putative ATP-dependent endonuclease of the OLD family
LNITSLEIKGYRNLANIEIDFQPDVTVLIGENNSGKTNVLDALYAALRANRPVKQGAFDIADYHLADRESLAGSAGPIELIVRFAEGETDEWHDDVLAQFTDVVALDMDSNTNSVTLRVKGSVRHADVEEEYEWAFLNSEGNPFPRRHYTELYALQRLRPFYQLGALRDVHKEFNRRSTYFAPFVTDPTFSDELREDLSGSLSDINAKVLKSHAAFGTLKQSITAGAEIVAGGADVIIEAVPTRLSELLANTSVSMSSRGAPPFPLESHGSGAQSIAVLSLFHAYVEAKLSSQYDPLSRAILTLEEPEAHLHPSAIRLLWALISSLKAQVIVTSHSGDLLGEVPLQCVRRVRQTATGAKIYKVDASAFNADEMRHLRYGIQANRGELLFARHWLLVEGRTEITGFKRLSELLGANLYANGVRVVDCAQYGGVEPFVKLADQLGISWHCLCDGDMQGHENAAAATAQLKGRPPADHITQYAVQNIEAHLITLGFGDIYERHIAVQKRNLILDAPGTEAYANQVSTALSRGHKEQAIMEVCDAIEADRKRAPEPLRQLFDTCCRLARS